MNQKPTVRSSSGLNLGDIYYVLFRHKWKIAMIFGTGIVAALLLPLAKPAQYQSEAKLYIRYVLETKSPAQVGANDSRIRSPDERGESIINTEQEILTSLDLAQQVADAIGPEKILARAGGGSNRYAAAGVIQQNLSADVPKNSSVIRLIFKHSDPDLVQPVLRQLIDFYFKKHVEIHAVGAFDEFLTRETDHLRSSLSQTEDDLRTAKAKVGVISLEDSKRVHAEQISRIRQAVFEAEANLAERQCAINELSKLLHPKSEAGTNLMAAASEVAVPPDVAGEYRRICSFLETLEHQDREYRLTYTPENTLRKAIQQQIATNEDRKRQLESEHPGLLSVRISETHVAPGDQVASPRADLVTERARALGLESRIKVLTEQLDKIRKEATAVDEAEGTITKLQRDKELGESHYKHFIENLEQSRMDEELGAGKVSNISPIQLPSPPVRAASKLHQMIVMVVFASIAAAVGLAFLIEFYLDRSLKRPLEIETRLGLPLLLSIPFMIQNGKPHRLKWGKKTPVLPLKGAIEPETGRGIGPDSIGTREPEETEKAGEAEQPTAEGHSRLTSYEPSIAGHSVIPFAPWNAKHRLRPFSEALRDRLIAFFESKNLTHKPKLVAVTSCTAGAGVTTIAASLADSLSETGDGKVLLVDMNLEQRTAHEFFNWGKLRCDLDDALETGKRAGALVQENLYVVTEATNGNRLVRVLPKRFTYLMPKLKASDYDYIIFDMPPITQISVTPRLARFMDMVLLVLESEKTDRDLVKRATSLLSKPRPNLGVILNKSRTYVPHLLQQEL